MIKVLILILLGIYPVMYSFYRLKGAAVKELPFFIYLYRNESIAKRAFEITNLIWLIFFIWAYEISVFFPKTFTGSFPVPGNPIVIFIIIVILWLVISEILAEAISVKAGNYLFAFHLWGNILLCPILLILVAFDRSTTSGSPEGANAEKNLNDSDNNDQKEAKSIIKMPNWEEFTVKEIMVPRIDIVGIKDDSTMAELFDMFVKKKFSRFPVYNKDMDSIIGVVALKDFIEYWNEESKAESITGIIRPVLFIPETKKVATLLKDFKEKKTSIAVVLNEYGGTTGLVTLHDLMENLVGEIKDEYDVTQDEEILEIDGSYVMSGKVEIERVQEKLQIKLDFGDYETISGYIFSLVGKVPHTGEKIRTADLIIEILSADKRKINRIKIKKAFT